MGQWQFEYLLDGFYEDTHVKYVVSEPFTITQDGPAQQDISLIAYDTIIRGTIIDSDGSVLDDEQYVFITIESSVPDGDKEILVLDHRTARFTDVVSGTFEYAASTNTDYIITIRVNCGEDLPEECESSEITQQITTEADGPTDIVIQVAASNTATVGAVWGNSQSK